MTTQEAILQVINSHNGIKGTELVMKVLELVHCELYLKKENYNEILDKLVESGEITEIEYSVPSMNYRIKSFYLPKNAQISISK